MNLLFEVFSWLAMIALVVVSVPQMILNYQRKSAQGVSWLTFILLLFGLVVLFIRSYSVTDDSIIRLNYGLSALVALAINLQFVYYRIILKK